MLACLQVVIEYFAKTVIRRAALTETAAERGVPSAVRQPSSLQAAGRPTRGRAAAAARIAEPRGAKDAFFIRCEQMHFFERLPMVAKCWRARSRLYRCEGCCKKRSEQSQEAGMVDRGSYRIL